MSTSRKRPAEISLPAPPVKKQAGPSLARAKKPRFIDPSSREDRTNTNNNANSNSNPFIDLKRSVQVSVKLNQYYKDFPKDLLKRLESKYQKWLTQINKPSSESAGRYKYAINKGRLIRSHTLAEKFISYEDTYTAPEEGNVALLAYIIEDEKWASYLKCDIEWVEVRTRTKLSNPEFLQLFAVGYEQLGWTFDGHGCLAIYEVSEAQGRLVATSWFLERIEMEVGVKAEPEVKGFKREEAIVIE